MTKKDLLLIRIEKLQDTRNYADEIESIRLTNIIAKLLAELETLDNE